MIQFFNWGGGHLKLRDSPFRADAPCLWEKVLYSYLQSELEMILPGKDLLNDPKLEHESQPSSFNYLRIIL